VKTVEIAYRYGSPDAPVPPRPQDADATRRRLDAGNRSFASLLEGLVEDGETARRVIQVDPYDLGLEPGKHAAPRQRPFAAVLGCSDARVPIELIFNEGPNDLFVVRVAGNGLGSDVLGSLRYAIDHLRSSLRLVVVLGHSGCGAMSAAVDSFLEPAGYLSLATNYALRSILDRQLIVVQATARKLTSVFGGNVTRNKRYREALIEASIVTNAALAAYTMQQELHGLDPLDLRAVYGVYVLQSREVWTPVGNAGVPTGLADPPRDLASFVELGEAIAGSDRIRSLITSR
jgi:carbonic anhydrase